jgi:hypothetical protein
MISHVFQIRKLIPAIPAQGALPWPPRAGRGGGDKFLAFKTHQPSTIEAAAPPARSEGPSNSRMPIRRIVEGPSASRRSRVSGWHGSEQTGIGEALNTGEVRFRTCAFACVCVCVYECLCVLGPTPAPGVCQTAPGAGLRSTCVCMCLHAN